MATQPQRILIVEDESAIRESLTEFLEGEGYSVVAAADGYEAQAALERDSAFSLLITDFRMPRVDGTMLLDWCRARSLHFPVIFISADYVLLPKEKVALGDCCADILPKPFQLRDLTKALQAAWQRKHDRDCSEKA